MKRIYAIGVIVLCIGSLICSCNSSPADDSGLPGLRVTYNGQRYVADSVNAHRVNSSIVIDAYTGGQKRFEMDLQGQTVATYDLGSINSVYVFDNSKTYNTNGWCNGGTVKITKFTDAANRINNSKYTDSTTYINGNFGFGAHAGTDSVLFNSGYFNLVPIR